MTVKSALSTKPANKTVLEQLGMSKEDLDEGKPTKRKSSTDAEKGSSGKEKRKRDKKSTQDRREELLKQLKAVENAIAKKRTKMAE